MVQKFFSFASDNFSNALCMFFSRRFSLKTSLCSCLAKTCIIYVYVLLLRTRKKSEKVTRKIVHTKMLKTFFWKKHPQTTYRYKRGVTSVYVCHCNTSGRQANLIHNALRKWKLASNWTFWKNVTSYMKAPLRGKKNSLTITKTRFLMKGREKSETF